MSLSRRIVLLLAASLAIVQSAGAQTPDTVPRRDLMDVLARILGRQPKLADTVTPLRRLTLTVLPSFSANPAIGLSLGISGNAAIALGPPETTTLSTLSASVSYTTKKQFNILVRSNLYQVGNRAKLEGDWRYLDTSQPTFGLGPAQPESRETDMNFNLIRFHETAYLEAVTDVLLGVGFHLDRHYHIEDANARAGLPSPYVDYYGGQAPDASNSVGLSANVLSDTRDNPINPGRGYYAGGSFRTFQTWLGSDDDWQSLQGEFRVYPPLSRDGRQILAVWGLSWLSFGQVPYLDLPAIGWDYNNRMGRGYAQGRIRARDLFYTEVEYRRVLTRDGLLGAVAFANVTSATDPATRAFQTPDFGIGIGLRIKLNKNSNSNIAIDYGFGAKGSHGVFFGTGEAF